MGRAIAYLRVSTEGQAVDGVSLDAQKAKVAAWCDINGYELAGVYVDAGISGKRADNRPGLQAALNDCGKGDALVVYSLSRLARSTKDTLSIAERLEKTGTDLVSLSERIDTTSAAGKMLLGVLAVLSEFERNQLVERTKAALSHKKASGERVGAVPYGYRLLSNGKTLEPDPAEQAVITEARELRAGGMRLTTIARELDKRGFRSRTGKVFFAQQVKRMVA